MPPINLAIKMLNTALSRASDQNKTIVSAELSEPLYAKMMQHFELEQEPETMEYEGISITKNTNFKPIQIQLTYSE